MADRLLHVAEGFWNIRGSFKIAGFVDIGTQASLVRRPDGSFLLLDCYTLTGEVEREVLELTDGGAAVGAILNLHPFHTVHVRKTHERFPNAKLFGTARHVARAPELPWEPIHTEDAETHARFDEFLFSVPRGVDFISTNEHVHFSSVLALHRSTRTLHVDDTLMYTALPFVGGIRFHPTLKSALQPRPGAGQEFRDWALELAEHCEAVDHLCAAHSRPLLGGENTGPSIADRIRDALGKVAGALEAHDKRHAGP